MFVDKFVQAVGQSLFMAYNKNNDFTWEEMNEYFHVYSPDRRYKIWFEAASRTSGIVRVGRQEYLYEIRNESILIRTMNYDNVFQLLPSMRISQTDDGWFRIQPDAENI